METEPDYTSGTITGTTSTGGTIYTTDTGSTTVSSEGWSVTTDPVTPEPKPARRARGALEVSVKSVTDAFDRGDWTPDGPLTPHRIGKRIGELEGNQPSTGAVAAVLDRWAQYDFCTLTENPRAFGGYTDGARTKGLRALKEEYRARDKDA